jgi:hypothetical protein
LSDAPAPPLSSHRLRRGRHVHLAWGVFSSLNPQWLFRFAGLPDLNHPSIFACLAMVVGIYGLLYWEVARVPERGWAIAAVGLLGKVLGPIGLAALIARGTWPPSTLVLCLTNDFVWWPFFTLYLRDAWNSYKLQVSGFRSDL